MFTNNLREIRFRQLEEEEEYPVLEKSGSGLLLQLNWGVEVSLVPNVSLSGNQRAPQDTISQYRVLSTKSLYTYFMVKPSFSQSGTRHFYTALY